MITIMENTMKLKSISLCIASACYALGVGAATLAEPSSATLSSGSLKKLPFDKAELEQMQQRRQQSRTQNNVLKRADNVNQHITRANSAEKFSPEDGLDGSHTYIVRMKEAPVTQYQGGVQGLNATALSNTNNQGIQGKFNLFAGAGNKTDINAYQNYLKNKQNQFIDNLSARGMAIEARKQFTVAINGFSVELNQQQASELARLPQVTAVTRSTLHELHTDIGPQLIGAEQVWQSGGEGVPAMQGEGLIVGVLDTGINTDHPSFAAIGGDGYQHVNPFGDGNYVGDCAKDEFVSLCNDKLIGVRSYDVITDVYNALEFQAPDHPEWMEGVQIRPKNGEDYNGHGTHTASTAAGNILYDVPYVVPQVGDGDGIDTGLNMGTISGVAPHANIISYQVCYPGGAGDPYAGCPTEALLAGIEDAIADGVDVINFSIGGSEQFPWENPVELAFLSAQEAGIVVAASAGNSGTDGFNEYMSSADHTSPWLLTVGATTTGRTIDITGKSLGSLSGGDTPAPGMFEGKGISGEFSGEIVLAANYGDELCLEPFATDTFTENQIVVCKRGDIARVAKADNVAAGGAGGFVLYNTQYGDSLNNDVYSIPGVHISSDAQWSLIPWLQSGSGHMATITASEINRNVNPDNADMLADFSSRGPSQTNPEHLIPSISAPGVDIYAGAADEHPFSTVNLSSKYAVYSGTSMASPHISGAAALIRQVNPDWTATQIQSAIMMTANRNVRYDAGWPDGITQAGIYRAGSGRVDVAAAASAGLILDETSENFMLANPQNGGDVKALNMPELVNFNCKGSCSWVRTFEATHDGSWTVETQTGEYSVQLASYPSSFALKKGQKQSVVFEAKILDSQSAINNSEVEVHGSVVIKEDNQQSADSYIPVALKYNHGTLPENITMSAHRNNDVYTLRSLTSANFKNLNVTSYKEKKADLTSFSLPQAQTSVSPFISGVLDESTYTHWVDVPAGSKRLIAEVISSDDTTAIEDYIRGDLDIIVGIDANGDNMVQMDEEAICISLSDLRNDFCNINNPDAGKYWVVFHNWKNWWDPSQPIPVDTYTVATAVVGNDLSDSIQVSGPQSYDGASSFELDVEWNMDMMSGDIYYGAMELGSDANNMADLGLIPYRLNREKDDTQIQTSQTMAAGGDVVDVTINVMENTTGSDRNFTLTTTLPEGMSPIADSIQLHNSGEEQLMVDGNTIVVSGVQADTSKVAPEYLVTTNLQDAMCRTPSFGLPNHDGGYIDLLTKVGFGPDWGGVWNENLSLPFAWLWGGNPTYSLYHNHEYQSYPQFTLSPMGYLQFDDLPLFFPFHMPFPMTNFPDAMVAPLWKGEFFGQAFGTPYEPNIWDSELNSGITFAYTEDQTVIVEWDNVRSQSSYWDWILQENVVENNTDRYDFEVIFNLGPYQFGAGQYEVIMAYDNLDFAGQSAGTVGIHGYSGIRSTFGPLDGYSGTQYAFDDIDEKLSNGLVLCYDYVGPQMSRFEVTLQARVDEDAAGKDLNINTTSDVEGIATVEVQQAITVNGNLTMGVYPDLTINENESVNDLLISYADADNRSNIVTVSGDNVTAEIHSHQPGGTFSLLPELDFHGETMVTVTVADASNPSDMASASFMLTVLSDGIEYGCTDANANNFDENATDDNGSCIYPEEEKKEKKKSGGALAWLTLLMLPLALRRRSVR
ncbi:S8 family peptidase [Thalassotalea litorea]|uniref:S8 family peptidase n=2 Tax=Thalassotalea litorea TaxID=2020715 RepID=A0A5R9ISF3_9GAMM|nr:S8 family peptidase [Thalassotalea litorea]